MARPQIKLDQGQALPTRMPEAVTTEPHSHPWASPIHQNNSGEVLVAQLCLTLCDPMDCNAFQASLSMGFSRQEYYSGLPFRPPGNFPDPGIEPGLLHCRQILYCLSHQGRPFTRIPIATVAQSE